MHLSDLKLKELCEIRDALNTLYKYGIDLECLKGVVEQRITEYAKAKIVEE